MSAIVIKWINKNLGYEHTALLLNNLGINQTLYISIYISKDKNKKRFSSQTLEQDKISSNIVEYVAIPTCEDGNKFGLSEGIIAKYWMEIYGFKKTDHQQYVTDISPVEAKSHPAENPANEAAEPTPVNEADAAKLKLIEEKIGQQHALTDLSSEFKQFKPHQFFVPETTLDCTKFIAKLLQKGGLDLFSDPELVKGYIGVPEMIEIAKNTTKAIIEMQPDKTKVKDPKLAIVSTSSWVDRQQFRH